MCYVDLECTASAGRNYLYDLYFDEKFFKGGLTLEEAREEIRKREEEEKE